MTSRNAVSSRRGDLSDAHRVEARGSKPSYLRIRLLFGEFVEFEWEDVMGSFGAVGVVSVLAALMVHQNTLDGDGDPSVSPAEVARAAKLLASKPPIVKRERLPDIKLLETIGSDTVNLRTDHVILERLKIDGGLYDDRHSPPDSIKLLVGGSCRIGGGRTWQDIILLKIDGETATFQRVAYGRRDGPTEPVTEIIEVPVYRDARWTIDPNDSTRVTYIELHEKGQKRIEKHYRNDAPDGEWTSWHSNGRLESKQFYRNGQRVDTWTEWYPNGQRKREVHYREGVAVGRETWWDATGRPSAFQEHPAPPPTVDSPARK
jgi:hypothetical protein